MPLRFSLAVSCLIATLSLGVAQAHSLHMGLPPGNELLFAINDRGELLRFRAGKPNAMLARQKINGLDETCTHLFRVKLDTGGATNLASVGKKERTRGRVIEP